ncbi:MAG: histidine phosphatase family protein [Deltaproteobacteria bacterium]|nr:MAG: histidine phosphatase family protein [Deltaproteobacteria bacterium]
MEPIKGLRTVSGVAVMCLILALLLGCATTPEDETSPTYQSPPGTKTTIILLRHAGRDIYSAEADDPLTWQGRRRAQHLVEVIGHMGVSAIYCTNLRRNRDTAQPLADHLGLKLNLISQSRLYDYKKLSRDLLDEFLTKHAGGVVVWVGNLRNLEEMYKLLDGTGSPPTEYGDVFMVEIPDVTPPRIKKMTYGE